MNGEHVTGVKEKSIVDGETMMKLELLDNKERFEWNEFILKKHSLLYEWLLGEKNY